MGVPIDSSMVNHMGPLHSFLVRMGLGSTSDHSSVVAITLMVTLLCACIVIGHLLEENRWMNESITTLILGVCTGIIVLLFSKGKSSHRLLISEELFFIYLLPPIIFNAGFQVKKKQFFRNFITIVLFGAVGTFISFAIVSSDLFNKFFTNVMEESMAGYKRGKERYSWAFKEVKRKRSKEG